MENNDKLRIEFAKKINNENTNNDSLKNAIENYKNINPQKYISAQLTGEHIMNSDYELIHGIDKEEELITLKLLQQLINNGITEFTDEEQLILQKYNINT